MAKYSNGIDTKKKIIDISKLLFYKKGYYETSFNEICSTAEVNNGSVVYHFKNKGSIAAQIYASVLSIFFDAADSLFPSEDEITRILLSGGIHQKAFYQDLGYRRFSAQLNLEYSLGKLNVDFGKQYHLIYHYLTENTTSKRSDFYISIFKGLDGIIENYFYQNLEQYTLEEMILYSGELYYTYLPRDQFATQLHHMLDLLKHVHIKNQGFDFVVSRD